MESLSKFQFPDKSKNLFIVLAIVGFVILGVGIASEPVRAYHSYVLALYYFLCLTMGGIVFAATQHVTNAGWSASVRRIGEAFFSAFTFMVLALLVLYLVHHKIYEWSHVDVVANDKILSAKKGYLNSGFFGVRLVIILSLWAVFGFWMRNNSIAQDSDKDIQKSIKNSKIAAAFLPIFALSFSFMTFDLVMSLEPHFFSTMYAVYCFAGLFLSTLAMMIVFIYYLWDKGYLKGYVNENHFHDLGKLMFAMVVFWAYVAFCQFMLIWYANLPEETFFFLNRGMGGWRPVSYGLIFVKFVIPFFLLLPRGAKRNPCYLKGVALWILAAQLFDFYWLVMPSALKDGPKFPWIEVGAFAGFLGVFVLIVTRFLSQNSIVAKNDPRLHEALHLHQ